MTYFGILEGVELQSEVCTPPPLWTDRHPWKHYLLLSAILLSTINIVNIFHPLILTICSKKLRSAVPPPNNMDKVVVSTLTARLNVPFQHHVDWLQNLDSSINTIFKSKKKPHKDGEQCSLKENAPHGIFFGHKKVSNTTNFQCIYNSHVRMMFFHFLIIYHTKWHWV